jgi:hypothetical protein
MSERITPMADDEQSMSGSVSALFQEFVGQLRAAAEKAGGPHPSWPPPPGMPPLPAAVSAAQVTAITDSIAAQRRSIKALTTQLAAFDEQLAVLENMLGPIAQWSKTWADLEQRFLNLSPKPDAGG